MKATLTFELPEEAAEHRLALDGSKWMAVCHELDQWLRRLAKHENRATIPVEEARNRLREEMTSLGLSFD